MTDVSESSSALVPSPRQLVELPDDRALALLAEQAPGIGRLAFCMFDTAHIDVVNFIVDKGDMIFRIDANAKLMAVGRGVQFTFQVDEIDPLTRCGWIVTVVGPVRRVHGAEAEALSRRLTPWVGGEKRFIMRLTPRRVFGRSLVQADGSPGPGPWSTRDGSPDHGRQDPAVGTLNAGSSGDPLPDSRTRTEQEASCHQND